ncbi:hypothetical protein DFH08DRAFT_1054520 [Mycena albidolilacea]|uniref:Uncharacterized protein n=1 Tax=Mycena albidolilacea TaxID=1033008 RepID=A0AAD7E9Y0_9AGAR|nr:hypothetical protein DFH08DRAFT_1054520 [Mycena albidolilacea]
MQALFMPSLSFPERSGVLREKLKFKIWRSLWPSELKCRRALEPPAPAAKRKQAEAGADSEDDHVNKKARQTADSDDERPAPAPLRDTSVATPRTLAWYPGSICDRSGRCETPKETCARTTGIAPSSEVLMLEEKQLAELGSAEKGLPRGVGGAFSVTGKIEGRRQGEREAADGCSGGVLVGRHVEKTQWH